MAAVLNVLTAAMLTVLIATSWTSYRSERLAERGGTFMAPRHDFATQQLQFAVLLMPTLIVVVSAGCWLSARPRPPEERWALLSVAAVLAALGGIIVDICWVLDQALFVL
ncbi:hypothetical protein [Actinocatenispora sera]|uniref:hypothetical protein n=1 Tax=Actinocatenispora sera TaxID=390989 RepID=UPI0012EDE679|nr:hypothetical protein [Actinocatenispora sera]